MATMFNLHHGGGGGNGASMVNDMVRGGGGGNGHPSCLMPSSVSSNPLIIKEDPGLGVVGGGFGDVSSHVSSAAAAASLHSQSLLGGHGLHGHHVHHHHHPAMMRSAVSNTSSAVSSAHSWMQGAMLEQSSK